MTDLFSQINDAEEQGRGRKITEPAMDELLGYQVKILNHSIFESKRGRGTVFVAEFEIVGESGKPPVDGATKALKGEKYSWVQFPTGTWGDSAKGNIKAYCAAVLASVGKESSSEGIKDVTENKYTGTVLDLEVEHILTEKAQRDYFVHTWYQASEAPDGPSIVGSPETPVVPVAPPTAELTKVEWLAGEGPGTEHPQNRTYEYSPAHVDWGVRPATPKAGKASQNSREEFSDDDIPF